MPSQPVQEELPPPHTPHASKTFPLRAQSIRTLQHKGKISFDEDASAHLLGTPSQPRHNVPLPPHTPHASKMRLELTVNATMLLRMVLVPPKVSEM